MTADISDEKSRVFAIQQYELIKISRYGSNRDQVTAVFPHPPLTGVKLNLIPWRVSRESRGFEVNPWLGLPLRTYIHPGMR